MTTKELLEAIETLTKQDTVTWQYSAEAAAYLLAKYPESVQKSVHHEPNVQDEIGYAKE